MLPSQNNCLFPEYLKHDAPDPFVHERLARASGYRFVAGVDEAGRGPLAGPVVAAAIILPDHTELSGVDDSKRMTPSARDEAFGRIQEAALTFAIGVVGHGFIDRFNILKASLEAMKRAVEALEPKPGCLLIDGIHPIHSPLPQKCLKKGDQISRSISAASVLAKVYRDRIMNAYHAMYPQYGFDTNKGYGTRHHIDAVRLHGPCPIHRLTFKRVRPD